MVKLENLSFSYNKEGNNILNEISFSLENGEILAVLGNNGCGKSTLLKCMDKILPTKNSALYVNGENVFDLKSHDFAQNLAFVMQENRGERVSVFDSVLLGRKPYIKWEPRSEDIEIAEDAIKTMGLEELSFRDVATLSSGETQKVLIARAIAQRPKLLLLDEPTSNLDPKNQHEVLLNVQKIAKEMGISVVIIIHDLNLAIRYCHKFLFLKDSEIKAFGGLEVMTPDIIEEVYDLHVHVTKYMDVPVIVPFPRDVAKDHKSHYHEHLGVKKVLEEG